jgi:hypothetical protein
MKPTMNATSLRARPEEKLPRTVPVPDEEIERPKVWTIVKLIWNTIARLFHDPVGMVLGSAFLLIMLWGYHGEVELLGLVWKDWWGPGSPPADRPSIIPGIPWDQEWISYAIGAVLLVVIPVVLIKLVYKQRLGDYGLGLPPKGRWGITLLSGALLLGISLPAFLVGAKDASMQATYPLYRGAFSGLGQFLVYQAGYFLFFLAIEFTFRGYLLFGLYNLRDRDAPPGVSGVKGPLVFGYYAIFISMLSYTAWHLGKPIPELWGTLIWGIAAGTVALVSGTIWHIVIVHYLLNVFLDFLIWRGF